MKPSKYPLQADRLRTPPREGWSWVDRRFLREKASRLDRDAILLYFFLAAVSDRDGLSYWGDAHIGALLHMTASAVVRARDELERQDLIAYEAPLYQVLSITTPCPRLPSQPQSIGDLLGRIARGCQPPGDAP